jgi:S-adenosylmethionine decarboxylase proenzyme
MEDDELKALGTHILVEFYNANPTTLNQTDKIGDLMNQAAELAGATIVSSNFHHFSPHGVSGVVIIAESHLTIHTWPEYGYAAVDLFTCGDTVDPWIAFDFLKNELECEHQSAIELKRGQVQLVNQNLKELHHKPVTA